jgi:hypothetical protein
MKDGQVQKKSRVVEVKIEPSLVAKLSSELLFTLENVEQRARNLKELKWLPRSKKATLDVMLEDTRKMNGLLKELMSTLRPEDES